MYVLSVYARICTYLNICLWEIHTSAYIYVQYVHIHTYLHIDTYTYIYWHIRIIHTYTYIRTDTCNTYRYMHILTIRSCTYNTYRYDRIHTMQAPYRLDTYRYVNILTYTYIYVQIRTDLVYAHIYWFSLIYT